MKYGLVLIIIAILAGCATRRVNEPIISVPQIKVECDKSNTWWTSSCMENHKQQHYLCDPGWTMFNHVCYHYFFALSPNILRESEFKSCFASITKPGKILCHKPAKKYR